MTEDDYEELLQELGAIELQMESLKQRREELIQQLEDEGLTGVKVTPAGKKLKNSKTRQEEKHE